MPVEEKHLFAHSPTKTPSKSLPEEEKELSTTSTVSAIQDKTTQGNSDTRPTLTIRPPSLARGLTDDLSASSIHIKSHFSHSKSCTLPPRLPQRSVDDLENEDDDLYITDEDLLTDEEGDDYSDFEDDESFEDDVTFYGIDLMSTIWEESTQDLRSVSTRRTSLSARGIGRTAGGDPEASSPRAGSNRPKQEELENQLSPLFLLLDHLDKISSPDDKKDNSPSGTDKTPKRTNANTTASPRGGKKRPSLFRLADAKSLPALDLAVDDITANNQPVEEGRPHTKLGETILGLAKPSISRAGGLASYFQREDSFRQEQESQKKHGPDEDADQKVSSPSQSCDKPQTFDGSNRSDDDDEYTFVSVTTDGGDTLISEYSYYEETEVVVAPRATKVKNYLSSAGDLATSSGSSSLIGKDRFSAEM